MSLLHFARLALVLEHALHFVKKLGWNNQLVFALEDFAVSRVIAGVSPVWMFAGETPAKTAGTTVALR